MAKKRKHDAREDAQVEGVKLGKIETVDQAKKALVELRRQFTQLDSAGKNLVDDALQELESIYGKIEFALGASGVDKAQKTKDIARRIQKFKDEANRLERAIRDYNAELAAAEAASAQAVPAAEEAPAPAPVPASVPSRIPTPPPLPPEETEEAGEETAEESAAEAGQEAPEKRAEKKYVKEYAEWIVKDIIERVEKGGDKTWLSDSASVRRDKIFETFFRFNDYNNLQEYYFLENFGSYMHDDAEVARVASAITEQVETLLDNYIVEERVRAAAEGSSTAGPESAQTISAEAAEDLRNRCSQIFDDYTALNERYSNLDEEGKNEFHSELDVLFKSVKEINIDIPDLTEDQLEEYSANLKQTELKIKKCAERMTKYVAARTSPEGELARQQLREAAASMAAEADDDQEGEISDEDLVSEEPAAPAAADNSGLEDVLGPAPSAAELAGSLRGVEIPRDRAEIMAEKTELMDDLNEITDVYKAIKAKFDEMDEPHKSHFSADFSVVTNIFNKLDKDISDYEGKDFEQLKSNASSLTEKMQALVNEIVAYAKSVQASEAAAQVAGGTADNTGIEPQEERGARIRRLMQENKKYSLKGKKVNLGAGGSGATPEVAPAPVITPAPDVAPAPGSADDRDARIKRAWEKNKKYTLKERRGVQGAENEDEEVDVYAELEERLNVAAERAKKMEKEREQEEERERVREKIEMLEKKIEKAKKDLAEATVAREKAKGFLNRLFNKKEIERTEKHYQEAVGNLQYYEQEMQQETKKQGDLLALWLASNSTDVQDMIGEVYKSKESKVTKLLNQAWKGMGDANLSNLIKRFGKDKAEDTLLGKCNKVLENSKLAQAAGNAVSLRTGISAGLMTAAFLGVPGMNDATLYSYTAARAGMGGLGAGMGTRAATQSVYNWYSRWFGDRMDVYENEEQAQKAWQEKWEKAGAIGKKYLEVRKQLVSTKFLSQDPEIRLREIESVISSYRAFAYVNNISFDQLCQEDENLQRVLQIQTQEIVDLLDRESSAAHKISIDGKLSSSAPRIMEMTQARQAENLEVLQQKIQKEKRAKNIMRGLSVAAGMAGGSLSALLTLQNAIASSELVQELKKTGSGLVQKGQEAVVGKLEKLQVQGVEKTISSQLATMQEEGTRTAREVGKTIGRARKTVEDVLVPKETPVAVRPSVAPAEQPLPTPSPSRVGVPASRPEMPVAEAPVAKPTAIVQPEKVSAPQAPAPEVKPAVSVEPAQQTVPSTEVPSVPESGSKGIINEILKEVESFEIPGRGGFLNATAEFQDQYGDQLLEAIKADAPKWYKPGMSDADVFHRWSMDVNELHGGRITAAGEYAKIIPNPNAKMLIVPKYPYLELDRSDPSTFKVLKKAIFRPRIKT